MGTWDGELSDYDGTDRISSESNDRSRWTTWVEKAARWLVNTEEPVNMGVIGKESELRKSELGKYSIALYPTPKSNVNDISALTTSFAVVRSYWVLSHCV